MKAENQQDTLECEAAQPLLAAFALGEELLDAPTRAHILHCPACKVTLTAYQGIAQILSFDAPEAIPPVELRARLLATVEAQVIQAPIAAPKNQAAVAKRRVQRPIPRIWALWAGIAAMFVALLGWNISLQQQVDQLGAQVTASRTNWQTLVVLLNDPALQVQQIAGTSAHGTFWSTPTGQVACLMVEDLPVLTNEQVFQVWLQSNTGWVSGGTFASRNGRDWFMIRSKSQISTYSAIRVTAEPSGGSAAPSSPALLETNLTHG